MSPSDSVRSSDRVALVLLKRPWPVAVAQLAGCTSPPRSDAGLWVLAHHARVGAVVAASASNSARVRWLIANHERIQIPGLELQHLIAADRVNVGISTR